MWKGTKVAVKVLKDEDVLGLANSENINSAVTAREAERKQLLQEAHLLEELRHPNIVNFLGLCMKENTVLN